MVEIKIVTVASEEKFYLKWLIESCTRYGTYLIVLGMGCKWEGLIMKYRLMIDFLENEDSNTIICFVDAYDVIMTGNVNHLKLAYMQAIYQTQYKVIVASEFKKANNDISGEIFQNIQNFTFSASDNNSINSGTYIGKVSDLLEILKEMISYEEINDQTAFNIYKSKHPEYVKIDNEREFFNVSHILEDTSSFSYPNSFFLHRPGNNLMINFLRFNGYTITTEEERLLRKDSLKSTIKKLEQYSEEILLKLFS